MVVGRLTLCRGFLKNSFKRFLTQNTNMKKLFILAAVLSIGMTACKKSAAPLSPKVNSDRKMNMTVDNSMPATGANISIVLVAGNDGPDASTGITVNDLLPSGYTFVSATASAGSYASGVWSGFGLAKGENASLTIVAKVNTTGDYTNTATITGSEDDPDASNNMATVTIVPSASKVLMVSTLAGSTNGYAEGTGATAQFSSPRGLGVDAAGNVYVADHSNSRIRKITPAGVVTTLAGGEQGFADGIGSAAKFDAPNSLAVDAAGNVYVADAGNNRIRKITPAGLVSTIAGDGGSTILSQPLGVGVDAAGNVYVADANNSRIRKISALGALSTLAGSTTGGPGSAGYADGTGDAAKFSTPNGVVIDGNGNIYVSDAGNRLIRKITPAGVVSTLAGSVEGYADGAGTAARFENLTGPAIDASGNIYIGDIGNNRIRKITPAGLVSTVAGSVSQGTLDGPVETAQFANPYAIAVDAAGNLYVSDESNSRIRKIGY
jgi:uncharacterized repeat protein (TIGR01451 family)